jgi:hypothetical protein
VLKFGLSIYFQPKNALSTQIRPFVSSRGCPKVSFAATLSRVARWFAFQTKIPIWEKISESQIGKCYINDIF